MNRVEMSDRFDLLYNNITSNQAPGLNEWEKSIFLTKGQDEIIKNHLSPKANRLQDGFDTTPKRQVDFSSIIKYEVLEQVPDNVAQPFDYRALVYKYPTDLFISLNEQIEASGIHYTIIPITFGDYSRMMSRPYKYPPKYQAWRLITNNVKPSLSPSYTYQKWDLESALYGNAYFNIINKTSKTLNFTILARPSEEDVVVSETDSTVTIMCKIQTGGEHIYLSSKIESLLNSNESVTNIIGNVYFGYTDTTTYPEGNEKSFINFESTEASEIALDNLNGVICNHLTVAPCTEVEGSTLVEIIGRFEEGPVYKMRYVRRPNPIILVDLENGLEVNGYSTAMDCELPEELHEEILQRAVELAKAAWQGDVKTSVELGNRSE